MKGRLDTASAKSQANISVVELECQILTCRKLGCLPVSPPSLLSDLSPLFSHILLTLFSIQKKFCSVHFITFRIWRSVEKKTEGRFLQNVTAVTKFVCECFLRTLLVAGGAQRVITVRTAKLKHWALFLEIYSGSWWHNHIHHRGTICLSQKLPLTTQKTNVIKMSACGPWWVTRYSNNYGLSWSQWCVAMLQIPVTPLTTFAINVKNKQGNINFYKHKFPHCCCVISESCTSDIYTVTTLHLCRMLYAFSRILEENSMHYWSCAEPSQAMHKGYVFVHNSAVFFKRSHTTRYMLSN